MDAALKARVEAKVASCIATIEQRYKVTFRAPRISFNVRGTCGGKARYGVWEVDFNPILLAENVDHYLSSTVPHEVAHLATELIYPHAHRGGFGQKRRPHGHEWASIMRTLGADPDRCHTYDVSNARVKKSTSHEYKCLCCGHKFTLGPKRHAKMKSNPNAFYHPKCGKVQGRLVPVVAAAPAPARIVPTTVYNKVPAGETKLAKCYRLFENYPGYSRAEMINVFVQEVDMTPAGAATYYAQCKKMKG